MKVSSGGEGVRHEALLMILGGYFETYKYREGTLLKVATQDPGNDPSAAYTWKKGNFSDDELHKVFETWSHMKFLSFFIEVTEALYILANWVEAQETLDFAYIIINELRIALYDCCVQKRFGDCPYYEGDVIMVLAYSSKEVSFSKYSDFGVNCSEMGKGWRFWSNKSKYIQEEILSIVAFRKIQSYSTSEKPNIFVTEKDPSSYQQFYVKRKWRKSHGRIMFSSRFSIYILDC